MKRAYFQTTETITKNRKGWVEIQTDFSQVYDNFSKMIVRVQYHNSTRLLFWLLATETNKNNGISNNKLIFERFNQHMQEEGSDPITHRTFQRCFDDLLQAKALTRVAKGSYYLNPYFFWRDDKDKRIEFITDEAKDDKFLPYEVPTPE